MTTPASLAQAQKVLDLLRGTTTEEMQVLLENGDLLKAMVRADLSGVDRADFGRLLGVRRKTTPTSFEYATPEEQLATVRTLNANRDWGFSDEDFPAIPATFAPKRPNEMLLLSVYLPASEHEAGLERTFLELWASTNAPEGFDKRVDRTFQTDTEHLRAIGGAWTPGIRWVAFDPSAFLAISAKEALDEALLAGYDLAGTEVLMATLLFPEWARQFSSGSVPRPALSGLRLFESGRWASVPFFGNWSESGQFGLGSFGATSRLVGRTSPTVRRLS